MKLNKKIKNYFSKGKSIEFKIISSCLIIILCFALFVAIYTIRSFGYYIDESSKTKSQEISRQIVNNYEGYINDIINTFDIVIERLENIDIVNENDYVLNLFNEILINNPDISNIVIFDIDGNCIANTSNNNYNSTIVKQMTWFSNAVNEPSIHYFSSPYSPTPSQNEIYVTKYFNYDIENGRGIILMEIKFDKIITLAENSNLGENGQILIVDSNYGVVFTTSSDNEVTENLRSRAVNLALGTSIADIKSNRMFAFVETITNTRWRLAIFINIDESKTARDNFTFALLIISFFAIITTVIVVSFLSRSIAHPLKQLEKTMKEIEDADYFTVQEVNIGKQMEVASLSASFNNMMHRIKELMDKVVEEQEAQRKSELKALQNQINPHFLYNTLDSIVWLIDNDKNKEASEMVVSLAKLFRISISRGRNIISVKDEIEHAKSYLLIQSIRYANAFKYEFDVDPNVLEFTTMKLILQPLIENAIYHGLKNRIDEGKLKISAHLINNKIVFKVEDNGYGIKEEKIEELYRNFKNPDLNDGVGLKNVYLRLKIYYGDEANLLINSELDEGTIITIIIPTKSNVV